ncbi:acyl-CoA carboxylase epsilon subunit [Streptomyces sp. AM6-12]|uniref:acyl-CoA carboxylase epsilon subunit n=1 Tax=Streptomyces sp. AM6-12 TaxID=3345149 RepID=UPI0037AA4F0B
MGGTDGVERTLRVERGTATAEELAALTAVLLALRGRSVGGDVPPRPADGPRWRRPGTTTGWKRPYGLFGGR